MGKNNQLEIRTVSQLTGRFRIPSYQRGYRWERRQIEQLLNDIVESDEKIPYYLQPIVVSPVPLGSEESQEDYQYDYDIIDGQQRLTTLYIILKALETAKNEEGTRAAIMLEKADIKIHYSISYETRVSTQEFLENISQKAAESDKELILETPDHLYMWHAYAIVKGWIQNQEPRPLMKLVEALTKNQSHANVAKIIWYELPDSITDWKKFTELNIGKIPLTNSELIKALLMRSDNNDITEDQKSVIIQQWDFMEKELCNPQFWGFLTSRDMNHYDTKIDLLFDILAQKPHNSKDDFHTFAYFEHKFKENDAPKGKDKWNTIYLQYQQLRDWYLDRELYHKIGYLSTIDKDESLYQELVSFITKEDETTKNRPTNRQFRAYLEERIIDSLTLPSDVMKIEELCYLTNEGNTNHQSCIRKLLTLYNILYTQDYTKDRYDFHSHKNSAWSLEHIHAQNSEYLSKVDQRKEWIKIHLASLKRYQELPGIDDGVRAQLDGLAIEMEKYESDDSQITGKIFSDIALKYSELIVSVHDERATRGEYEHQLDNLALLSHNENAVFNNSTFDVKRHKMLKDMSSEHIPVCTQRVFLKAIPEADDNHPYFWGSQDRDAYIRDIRNVLKDYLLKVEKTSALPID